MYLSGLGIIDLYNRSSHYLVNVLTSIKSIYQDFCINKANVCIRKKF